MKNETRNISVAYLLLLFLMGGTLLSSRMDLGNFDEPLALAFSMAKAVIILISFMHFRRTNEASKLYFLLGLITLIVLVVGILDDLLTREI